MEAEEQQQEQSPKEANHSAQQSVDAEASRAQEVLRPFMAVPLELSIELGRADATIGELLEMGYHSVFVLNKPAGNNLDIYVNGVLLGRGEVLIIEDKVGIKINEIVERHD